MYVGPLRGSAGVRLERAGVLQWHRVQFRTDVQRRLVRDADDHVWRIRPVVLQRLGLQLRADVFRRALRGDGGVWRKQSGMLRGLYVQCRFGVQWKFVRTTHNVRLERPELLWRNGLQRRAALHEWNVHDDDHGVRREQPDVLRRNGLQLRIDVYERNMPSVDVVWRERPSVLYRQLVQRGFHVHQQHVHDVRVRRRQPAVLRDRHCLPYGPHVYCGNMPDGQLLRGHRRDVYAPDRLLRGA